MKEHLKYWAFILILSYGPTILIHYALRPLWFNKNEDHTVLTSSETLFTMLILPIYLVIINYWLTKRHDKKNFFLINTAIIVSCIFISARLHFLNWADSVGSRDNPDFGTTEVIALEKLLGSTVAVAGLIIAFVMLYRKRKVEK